MFMQQYYTLSVLSPLVPPQGLRVCLWTMLLLARHTTLNFLQANIQHDHILLKLMYVFKSNYEEPAQAILYLNAKVSQLLLKCYFLLFELNILLHDIMISKSNDLPSKQHENQTSETYDCRSSTRKVRQPKFEKSQSYNTLHFIESHFTPPYILFGKGV